MSTMTLIEPPIPLNYQIVESESGKFVVRGRFQRADTENRNGRIYSSKLWRKVLGSKELQERVKSRQMFGECDHPCLTDSNFRVLTADGWKDFLDITTDDKVWSRVNGEAVLSDVTGIVNQPYSGPAYHVSNTAIDSTFTPGHKIVAIKRPQRYGDQNEDYIPLSSIAANRKEYRHYAIPKKAKWNQSSQKLFSIPGVPLAEVGRLASRKNDVTQDLLLDAKLFSGFLGIYLAEGHLSSGENYSYRIEISQKKPWSRDYIKREILDKFPPELQWTETSTGFRLTDERLYRYLKPLGRAYEKYIPAEVKALSEDCLSELLFWFAIGDGRVRVPSRPKATAARELPQSGVKEALAETARQGHIPYTRRELFSCSERLIRDLHECLVRSGGAGTLSVITPTNDYWFAGHEIRAEDKSPLYQLNVSSSDYIWLTDRVQIEEVLHVGNIYCLQTAHGNFYMEQNGKSFWTGNSDGTTSLLRTSHVVTKLYFDEASKDIIGEAEILDTPSGRILRAMFEAGAGPGISSRGKGSIVNGNQVHEDFSLDTFDFVAFPSTYGAYPAYEGSSSGVKEEVVSESVINKALSVWRRLMEYQESGEISTQRLEDISSLNEDLKSSALSLDEDSMTSGLVREILEQVDRYYKDVRVKLLSDRKAKNSVGKMEETMDFGGISMNEVDMLRQQLAEARQEINEAREAMRTHGQREVRALQESAERLQAEYDSSVQIIESMRDRVIRAEDERDEARADLLRTEAVVQELQSRLDNLPEDTERYIDASHQLIEAMDRKLQEAVGRQNATERLFGAALDRCNAAESLIEAMLDRIEREQLTGYVQEAAVAALGEDAAQRALPMLEKCETVEEVDELLETLQEFVITETASVHSSRGRSDTPPLPRRRSISLTEDALTSGTSQIQESVDSRPTNAILADFVVARIGGK